jgi:hypothetical protein
VDPATASGGGARGGRGLRGRSSLTEGNGAPAAGLLDRDLERGFFNLVDDRYHFGSAGFVFWAAFLALVATYAEVIRP